MKVARPDFDHVGEVRLDRRRPRPHVVEVDRLLSGVFGSTDRRRGGGRRGKWDDLGCRRRDRGPAVRNDPRDQPALADLSPIGERHGRRPSHDEPASEPAPERPPSFAPASSDQGMTARAARHGTPACRRRGTGTWECRFLESRARAPDRPARAASCRAEAPVLLDPGGPSSKRAFRAALRNIGFGGRGQGGPPPAGCGASTPRVA